MYTFDSRSFAERRAAIVPSLDYYRLPRATFILLGGAALAEAGLNAYVPGMGPPFDVDGLLPEAELRALHRDHKDLLSGDVPKGILNLSLMGLEDNPVVYDLTSEKYDTMLAQKVPASDVFPYARLQPTDAAHLKILRGAPKDSVGLVQAHLTAYREEHPVIDDPAWQSVIGRAIQALPYAVAVSQSDGIWVPGWVDMHLQNDFSHEAFDTILRP